MPRGVARASPRAVREVLARIRALGVPEDDITVERVEPVIWAQPTRAATALEWADVVGTARVNVGLTGVYLAFMFAAGVVAC